MIYKQIFPAIFIERPNRFLAKCIINNEIVISHVKNTGRCKEILVSGTKIYLEKNNSPLRKTAYSLIAAEKNGNLINIDSQAPNSVVEEGLKENFFINDFIPTAPINYIKREKTYGNSRFDFYCENSLGNKIFLEVKGVTLENNGIAMFPDAPTERGLKHVEELIKAKKEGFLTYIIFVIQMKNVIEFTPNKITHKAFADMLKYAQKQGVGILAYDCIVKPSSLQLSQKIKIIF